MDNPVTASFRWSVDEMLAAHRAQMRHSPQGRKIRRVVWTIAPSAVVVGSVLLVTRGFSVIALFFLILGAALLLSPLFARRMALKHYAQRPDREMLINWEFHPDYIVTKTGASSDKMEWGNISSVLQTPPGFFLYPSDQIFRWLPAHAFKTAAEKEAFIKLAKSSVKNYDQHG